MNPCIKLLKLIAEYGGFYDLHFDQAIEAMCKDLRDHQALVAGKKPEEPRG